MTYEEALHQQADIYYKHKQPHYLPKELDQVFKPKKPLTERLRGQRLGQALWNALEANVKKTGLTPLNDKVANLLFYIEDEELRKLLNDYLREL